MLQVSKVSDVQSCHFMAAVGDSIALSDLAHVGTQRAGGLFEICERCVGGPSALADCTADAADPAYAQQTTHMRVVSGQGIGAERARKRASTEALLARGKDIASKLKVSSSSVAVLIAAWSELL